MKNAVFITVRTRSTRLPRKCLLDLGGLTTIEYLIQRTKQVQNADGIILCTTDQSDDDELADVARASGVEVIRGSERDKLERWRLAAHTHQVEFFVTADGDDLFCSPRLMAKAIDQQRETPVDFMEGSKDLAVGAFTYGIKVSALEKVCEIKDTQDTEMMWVYFKETGLFECAELRDVEDCYKRPQVRMTLDYQEDFDFFKAVIQHFGIQSKPSVCEILAFLDHHPEIVALNRFRQQAFLNNQQQKTTLKIKEGVIS